MAKLTLANWKKTIYYLRRNGLKNTFYAAMERLGAARTDQYSFTEPAQEVLAAQRRRSWAYEPLFSILVPLFRTPREYLEEMIDSVLNQTYGRLELILADATEDDSVEKEVRRIMAEEQQRYGCRRIKYVKLDHNGGISENTNCGLKEVQGDYVGLLDHDDVLTPDALYRMAEAIESFATATETNVTRKDGGPAPDAAEADALPLLLYSDEDKCNQDRTSYYEPHFKTDFNLELLLSNNYICHFLVMKRELIQKLGFRKEYDGAQDYDLVLRAVSEILPREEKIIHIPAVLYHWRCHTGSTAENPQSKQYAYEAGNRALQDMAKRMGWQAEAYHKKHLGFYGLRYKGDLLGQRTDIGAVGGRLMAHGKVKAGGYTADGEILYEGLKEGYSGYMHRAVLMQDVDAVDIRMLQLRKECQELFTRATGLPWAAAKEPEYEESAPGHEEYASDNMGLSNDRKPLSGEGLSSKERNQAVGGEIFDWTAIPEGTDVKQVSLALGEALRSEGYRIVWDPEWSRRL